MQDSWDPFQLQSKSPLLQSESFAVFEFPKTKGDLLGFFARFDTYNPDTKFDLNHGSYKGLVGNYDPNTKEQFITAGLDYQPTKNIHFMPNIWYNSYKSQNTTLTGTALKDHDLVYRATFFFTFGK